MIARAPQCGKAPRRNAVSWAFCVRDLSHGSDWKDERRSDRAVPGAFHLSERQRHRHGNHGYIPQYMKTEVIRRGKVMTKVVPPIGPKTKVDWAQSAALTRPTWTNTLTA